MTASRVDRHVLAGLPQPIDGETRMSRSLDVLFGALRIREDEHRRRAVHLFGIQVWRGR